MLQSFVGELQTLTFRHRSALILPFAAPIVVAAVTRDGWPASGELLLGLILAVAGVWLRLWALRAIGKRARVQRAGAREILVQGPYARVRNPLYLANTSIAVGLAVLAGAGLTSVGVCSGLLLVYSLVVRHEERTLAGTFGESYETYVRTVPRWLPRLHPAAGPSSEPCAWRDIFARERGLLGVLRCMPRAGGRCTGPGTSGAMCDGGMSTAGWEARGAS